MSFRVIDPPVDPEGIQFPDTDYIRKNKAECAEVSKMGQAIEYIETFWDSKEKVFEYYRNLNPQSFYQNIDQFFRVKDRNTGKEYLFIHAIKYCQSKEVTGDAGGTSNSGLVENPYIKPHQIDGYWGMHLRPVVSPKSYNPNGTVREWYPKKEVIVYDWDFYDKDGKPTPFYDLYNSETNRFKTRNFYIGFVNYDPSKWGQVSERDHGYQVYNEHDFADHKFEDVWDLARSGFATIDKSAMDTWLSSKRAVELQRAERISQDKDMEYAREKSAVEKQRKQGNL